MKTPSNLPKDVNQRAKAIVDLSVRERRDRIRKEGDGNQPKGEGLPSFVLKRSSD